MERRTRSFLREPIELCRFGDFKGRLGDLREFIDVPDRRDLLTTRLTDDLFRNLVDLSDRWGMLIIPSVKKWTGNIPDPLGHGL